MGRYEVYPVEVEGGYEWSWRLVENDEEVSNSGGTYSLRSEAIAAAREDRGDGEEELFRSDGSSAGKVVQRGPEAIMLMRADGSLHGELDHAVNEDSAVNPQQVTIAPASTNDSAKEVS